MATTTLLTLVAQGSGSTVFDASTDGPWDVVESATSLAGGAALYDDDDATGLTIGAKVAIDSTKYGEPVLVIFDNTPPGFNPTALLVQARMKNNAEALSADPAGLRQMFMRLTSGNDRTVVFDREMVSSGGSGPIEDILIPATADPTWFTWWGINGTPDLDNPTEAGGWYQLDWSFSNDPGDKDALMGVDGNRLCLDMGIYWVNLADDVHVNWVDLLEVRLLVAGTYASVAPPCHLYPRDDDLGVGTSAIWPPGSSQQASGQPGGYY
jgi:hypothetical protein